MYSAFNVHHSRVQVHHLYFDTAKLLRWKHRANMNAAKEEAAREEVEEKDEDNVRKKWKLASMAALQQQRQESALALWQESG